MTNIYLLRLNDNDLILTCKIVDENAAGYINWRLGT